MKVTLDTISESEFYLSVADLFMTFVVGGVSFIFKNQSISLNRLIFVWSAFVSGPPKTDPLFGQVLQVMSDLLFCNAQLSMGK